MSEVRTAVIPAAGLGSRMLPMTKAVPKELLPIVDRPAIQHVVEEAVAAGIDHVVIVTSADKPALADHFSNDRALEQRLVEGGRKDDRDALAALGALPVSFVEQLAPRGLGDAVRTAAGVVGAEPFAVLLPDHLMADGGATLRALIDVYGETSSSVVALRHVDPDHVSSYGCAQVEQTAGEYVKVPFIVEKPTPEEAPSNVVVKSRYVFTPAIFDELRITAPGRGGEIQLTDAMQTLAARGELYGVLADDPSFDVGNIAGFVDAQLALGEDWRRLREA